MEFRRDIGPRQQIDPLQPMSSVITSHSVPPPPVPTLLSTSPLAPPPGPSVASTPIVQVSVLPQMPTNTVSNASTSTSTSPSTNPSTTSSSPGIISITALPPVDPTAVPAHSTYPKKHPHAEQKFKVIYLVPVFVFFGMLWGSLAAWLVYGCLTRRPKVQNDALIGGPRYVPAPPNDVEGRASLQRERDEMQEVAFSWPDVKQAVRKYEMDQHEEDDDEDDPFLLPPTPTTKGRSARTKSTRSTKTAYSDATYALQTDDESRMDDVPWESLRHKSIKRGILEQVRKEGKHINSLRPASTVRNTGTRNRNTVERRVSSKHGRMDSDVLIGDIDRMLAGSGSSRADRPSNYRADSTYTTISLLSSTTTGDKTQWKPGAGFRIVPESPLSSRGPTPAPPDDPSAYGMSWASPPTTPDRYTRAPVRHDTNRSRSRSRSRGTSPVKRFTTGPSTPARPHAAILPQSPPQITSPILENNLCFTPTRARSPVTTPSHVRRHQVLDFSRELGSPNSQPRTPDRGVNSPRPGRYRSTPSVKTPVKAHSTPVRTPVNGHRGGTPVKIPVKAHSSGVPVKTPVKVPQRPPMTSKSSSSSTTYTRDANGRAVEAAIKKVEVILEQSWSSRQFGDQGVGALSPTGFGRTTGS